MEYSSPWNFLISQSIFPTQVIFSLMLKLMSAPPVFSATAAVFTKYQSGIGLITPGVAEKIKLALDEYPEDWIIKSIDEAETHNARNWKYCEAILKRWKVEGIENGKSKDEHAGLVSYKGEWRDPRNIPTEEY